MDAEFSIEPFCDELGPAKVLHLWEPGSGLRGIVVVDNVACGPSIGGVRMAADVTAEEVFRLARAMTFKNAAAGLPHGGGKAGILADPHAAERERLVRAFGRAIETLTDYIPGPDMGTDETCMAWVHDEIGRAVGLPRALGGIPLDEIGATGFGVARCAEVAAPLVDLDLEGARVAIEGFGSVGRHAARFLEELGAVLVAASDSKGAVHRPEGIPVEELAEAKRRSGRVTAYEKADEIEREALFHVECEVLIPAARPDSLRAENADGVRARLVLEGANIPATPDAERILHERGTLCVPDFIANAGGVICAAVEYRGGTQATAFEAIAEKIRRNTADVLERSARDGALPRESAIHIARERVLEAGGYRRAF